MNFKHITGAPKEEIIIKDLFLNVIQLEIN